MAKHKDMTGCRFGRLLVVERIPSDRFGNAKWKCICDCGGVSEPLGQSLRYGATTSCGCISKELAVSRATHGASGSSEYKAWHAMIERCTTPSHHKWHRYGARGISVCERWMSYENFLLDMGPRHKGLTIDRKDNDGNYEPENCRWATQMQQGSNRSNNRIVALGGESLTISEAARRVGINLSTIRNRIRSGWTVDAALAKKPQPIKEN